MMETFDQEEFILPIAREGKPSTEVIVDNAVATLREFIDTFVTRDGEVIKVDTSELSIEDALEIRAASGLVEEVFNGEFENIIGIPVNDFEIVRSAIIYRSEQE